MTAQWSVESANCMLWNTMQAMEKKDSTHSPRNSEQSVSRAENVM